MANFLSPKDRLSMILYTSFSAAGFIVFPTAVQCAPGWGEPFEDEYGDPIVPGTCAGDFPERVLDKDGGLQKTQTSKILLSDDGDYITPVWGAGHMHDWHDLNHENSIFLYHTGYRYSNKFSGSFNIVVNEVEVGIGSICYGAWIYEGFLITVTKIDGSYSVGYSSDPVTALNPTFIQIVTFQTLNGAIAQLVWANDDGSKAITHDTDAAQLGSPVSTYEVNMSLDGNNLPSASVTTVVKVGYDHRVEEEMTQDMVNHYHEITGLDTLDWGEEVHNVRPSYLNALQVGDVSPATPAGAPPEDIFYVRELINPLSFEIRNDGVLTKDFADGASLDADYLRGYWMHEHTYSKDAFPDPPYTSFTEEGVHGYRQRWGDDTIVKAWFKDHHVLMGIDYRGQESTECYIEGTGPATEPATTDPGIGFRAQTAANPGYDTVVALGSGSYPRSDSSVGTRVYVQRNRRVDFASVDGSPDNSAFSSEKRLLDPEVNFSRTMNKYCNYGGSKLHLKIGDTGQYADILWADVGGSVKYDTDRALPFPELFGHEHPYSIYTNWSWAHLVNERNFREPEFYGNYMDFNALLGVDIRTGTVLRARQYVSSMPNAPHYSTGLSRDPAFYQQPEPDAIYSDSYHDDSTMYAYMHGGMYLRHQGVDTTIEEGDWARVMVGEDRKWPTFVFEAMPEYTGNALSWDYGLLVVGGGVANGYAGIATNSSGNTLVSAPYPDLLAARPDQNGYTASVDEDGGASDLLAFDNYSGLKRYPYTSTYSAIISPENTVVADNEQINLAVDIAGFDSPSIAPVRAT